MNFRGEWDWNFVGACGGTTYLDNVARVYNYGGGLTDFYNSGDWCAGLHVVTSAWLSNQPW
jgi:hypothetical protein